MRWDHTNLFWQRASRPASAPRVPQDIRRIAHTPVAAAVREAYFYCERVGGWVRVMREPIHLQNKKWKKEKNKKSSNMRTHYSLHTPCQGVQAQYCTLHKTHNWTTKVHSRPSARCFFLLLLSFFTLILSAFTVGSVRPHRSRTHPLVYHQLRQ